MRHYGELNQNTDEFARVIQWTPKWDAGAPMPQVFSNGYKVYLIYLISTPDPKWDGSYITMVDNTSETTYPLALVEFSASTFRFGIANDEVFCGLPLWNKGLLSYEAHIIENSNWVSELKNIHKIHPHYNEKRWKEKKHYAFLFHDEIFEVIATDYKVETFYSSFGHLALEVAKRMNED